MRDKQTQSGIRADQDIAQLRQQVAALTERVGALETLTSWSGACIGSTISNMESFPVVGAAESFH